MGPKSQFKKVVVFLDNSTLLGGFYIEVFSIPKNTTIFIFCLSKIEESFKFHLRVFPMVFLGAQILGATWKTPLVPVDRFRGSFLSSPNDMTKPDFSNLRTPKRQHMSETMKVQPSPEPLEKNLWVFWLTYNLQPEKNSVDIQSLGISAVFWGHLNCHLYISGTKSQAEILNQCLRPTTDLIYLATW